MGLLEQLVERVEASPQGDAAEELDAALGAGLASARDRGALREATEVLRLWGRFARQTRRMTLAIDLGVRALRGAALVGDVGLYRGAQEELVGVFEGALEPYAHAAELQEDVRARLRGMLERWVRVARPEGGEGSNSALFVSPQELERHLRGAGLEAPAEELTSTPEVLQAALIARLRRTGVEGGAGGLITVVSRLGLGPLEIWVLLILLAGQVDPGLRRAYTYAWNDFSQKLPDTTFLAGMLFGASSPIWAAVDGLLAPSSPLVFYHLVEVSGGETGVRRVRLSDAGLRLLQGVAGLSAELMEWCRQLGPAEARFAPSSLPASPLAGWLAAWYGGAGRRLRVLLRGASRGERRRLVHASAAELGRGLIVAELATVRRRPYEALLASLGSLAREAQLTGCVVLVEIPAAPQEEAQGAPSAEVIASALEKGLERFEGPVILGLELNADRYLPPQSGTLELDAPLVPLDRQASIWQEALARHGLPGFSAASLQPIIHRYPLDVNAVEEACEELVLIQALSSAVGIAEVQSAAGRKAQSALGGIAQRVSTSLGWGDVILPSETMEQVQEIISFARYRSKVMEEWGFREKVPYGRGLSALFWGPPGTGKTMMAGLIAQEIGMELFRVDLSQVVSKYIGETEKNLGRIFDEASQNNAIILFDEADSLFAKRTKVSSSNDRYANLEVNFLLQRMEVFEGVTVLTTNLESSIDEAFKRRIRFKIHFPFPAAEERALIWELMLPSSAAVAEGVDFVKLGRSLEMSGGLIRNAVVRAAFLAAERGGPIGFDELWEAGVKEFREMGGLVRE